MRMMTGSTGSHAPEKSATASLVG
jgi:hypothetical protein